MKKGDRVVCINNNQINNKLSMALTLYKVYIIELYFSVPTVDGIEIVDDSGNLVSYYVSRFISLKEYRKRKLGNIAKLK